MDSPKNLLDLPIEVRCIIFTAYFQDLVVTYPSLTPPLLLTSRQIRNEARPHFYKHTTFDLVSTEHVVEYMSSVPPSTLAALRHLKFCPHGLHLHRKGSFDISPSMSDILSLCDGLQLDTLEFNSYNSMQVDPVIVAHVIAAHILQLTSSNVGFDHLIVSMGQSQELQLLAERQLETNSTDPAYRPRFLQWNQHPVHKVRYDTKFKVVRCIADKGDDCMESDWRDQMGSAAEKSWKAQHKPILYGLRITRDDVPDTVPKDMEGRKSWTLQDLRRAMDKMLVKNFIDSETGLYVTTVGRGDFRRDLTVDRG